MNDGTENQVMEKRVLVIDDEAVVCLSCEGILDAEGYQVTCRQDSQLGLQEALSDSYDVILLDLIMPEMGGLEILKRLKEAGVMSEIVIITGYSTVETAVEAMKLGASDYISKPFTPDEVCMVLTKVMERSALIRENMALRKQLQLDHGFEGLVGESSSMQRVFSLIKRVATTDSTILVTGESGTGKEMVALALHNLSSRAKSSFIACDCSALVPTLLESELFGHVKGSFSGAIVTKQGVFEAADQGTLFLDEVANISIETQGKLLRALETHRIKKVGDTREREVDIRLIAATNCNLDKMVKAGTFREDLFYRLNVVPIDLPSLREREGDISKLSFVFLSHFQKTNATKVKGFTPEAMCIMENYHWPGNVRELKNIIRRLSILYDVERIDTPHLPPEMRRTQIHKTFTELPEKWEAFKKLKAQRRDAVVGDLERQFLSEALKRSGNNISKAAGDVGMQRTNFHALLRKYGLGMDEC